MTLKRYKEEILKDPRAYKLDFNIDGRLHYVYRVSKLGEHYYGSKTELVGLIEETIGIKYFTSSKNFDWRADFKTNPDEYKVKVIRRFNNKADKIIFESYLHQYFDVKNKSNFINRMNQTPYGFDTTGQLGENNPFYGKKHSDEDREKIGNRPYAVGKDHANYGQKASKETVKKMSENAHIMKGKDNVNYRPIYQIDKNTNEIIKKWETALDAKKWLGPGDIQSALNGRQKTAGGYKWSYVDTYNNKKDNNEQ